MKAIKIDVIITDDKIPGMLKSLKALHPVI